MWKTGLKVKINTEQEKMVNRGKIVVSLESDIHPL